MYNSTYAFSENRLIDGVELEGLEWSIAPALTAIDWSNSGVQSYMGGIAGGASNTWDGIKYTFSLQNVIDASSPGLTLTRQGYGLAVGGYDLVRNIPNYTTNDYIYGAGFATEKLAEALIFKRVAPTFKPLVNPASTRWLGLANSVEAQTARTSVTAETLATANATKGFSSFSAFKREMGPAGPGQAWHHIVEQTPGNVTRFGAESLHNTGNLITLPHGAGSIHARVSGYYSSIQPFTGGQRVRTWLSTQNFQAQSDFGFQVLKNHGWTPE